MSKLLSAGKWNKIGQGKKKKSPQKYEATTTFYGLHGADKKQTSLKQNGTPEAGYACMKYQFNLNNSEFAAYNVAMSMTKRYFTSLRCMRSYTVWISFMLIISTSQVVSSTGIVLVSNIKDNLIGE